MNRARPARTERGSGVLPLLLFSAFLAAALIPLAADASLPRTNPDVPALAGLEAAEPVHSGRFLAAGLETPFSLLAGDELEKALACSPAHSADALNPVEGPFLEGPELASRACEASLSLHLEPADFELNPQRGPPLEIPDLHQGWFVADPKTRIGGFRLNPEDLIGGERRLSLELHWGYEVGRLGLTEDEPPDPWGLAEGDWWDPRTYAEGQLAEELGHDLLNAASLGTLDRVERQKNLGTWRGVGQSLGIATERFANTATLGYHDNLVEQAEAEGRLGLGMAGRALSKTAYDLTPMEEVRQMAQEGDMMDAGQRASGVSMAVSKSAGLLTLGLSGAKAAQAYQETGSVAGALKIRRAQTTSGSSAVKGKLGEAALEEIVPETAQAQVTPKTTVKGKVRNLRYSGKSRTLDALDTSTGGRLGWESKNSFLRTLSGDTYQQAVWDRTAMQAGYLQQQTWVLWRGGTQAAIRDLLGMGLGVKNYGGMIPAWDVLHPRATVLPGMQREAR